MTVSAVLVAVGAAVWLISGVRLAVEDFRTKRLPTRVIWSTASALWVLYAVASLVEAEPAGLVGSALGAAACGTVLAAVHFAHPPSMGFGDVRLSVLNGLMCGWWGWQAALVGLAAGFTLALPQALVAIASDGIRAHRPLGPYLVAGAALVAVSMAATRGLVPAR